jgi:hypothetical protein
MVLVDRRKARPCWLRVSNLLGLLLLPALMGSHDLARPVLVCWVIEQSANIVNEQRIKKLGNFLLVGEIKSSLKWDPVSCKRVDKGISK